MEIVIDLQRVELDLIQGLNCTCELSIVNFEMICAISCAFIMLTVVIHNLGYAELSTELRAFLLLTAKSNISEEVYKIIKPSSCSRQKKLSLNNFLCRFETPEPTLLAMWVRDCLVAFVLSVLCLCVFCFVNSFCFCVVACFICLALFYLGILHEGFSFIMNFLVLYGPILGLILILIFCFAFSFVYTYLVVRIMLFLVDENFVHRDHYLRRLKRDIATLYETMNENIPNHPMIPYYHASDSVMILESGKRKITKREKKNKNCDVKVEDQGDAVVQEPKKSSKTLSKAQKFNAKFAKSQYQAPEIRVRDMLEQVAKTRKILSRVEESFHVHGTFQINLKEFIGDTEFNDYVYPWMRRAPFSEIAVMLTACLHHDSENINDMYTIERRRLVQEQVGNWHNSFDNLATAISIILAFSPVSVGMVFQVDDSLYPLPENYVYFEHRSFRIDTADYGKHAMKLARGELNYLHDLFSMRVGKVSYQQIIGVITSLHRKHDGSFDNVEKTCHRDFR